ncbi:MULTISPECIES: amino acid ABC transporter substrate-binding protein/permease [Carnobacterium]|uniref:Glutamine ABC transporter permease n=2 Tax=Carnobacterium inhibens TaxID=147709 RepID=U5SAC5_9LACT|nr:amino acid ABC transporter substrate-binding protein/permease [Carnobacterium inhibens]AGY82229.1 glutamine ABC transporter permease [Carnobacterium inhibens subsp. gilichinskyi]MBC9824372.1 ABC transporter permease subunit [Carnobacterium inhibens]
MIKKQKQFLGAVFILMLGLFINLATPLSASAEKGTESDPYVITTDVTYAPFEFKNADNEYVGIDVEILDAIAEDQGFTYELRPLAFSAGLQALESNQVDGMIAAMSITDERKESFDFSDPYFEAGTVMAISENNDEISSYEDLDGKTVAVKVGTTGAAFVEELKKEFDIKVNQFEDSATMYDDVVAGHSDAVFDDYPVMAYAVQQGLQLKFPLDPEAGDVYGFAVNKGQNPELLEKFNAGLANIKENGIHEDITTKYTGEDAESVTTSNGFFSLIKNNYKELLTGLGRTLVLTLVSFAIALVVGVILGLFSATSNKLLTGISTIYVTIMRGIPLIVLAFFVYFSIPQFLNIQLSAYIAGVITLSLNTTAYIAELVRGGIQAVAGGQLEAARSLGLPYPTSMRKIVLPQAIKIMIPSFINQFVITLKDTSILSVIGIVELTQTGKIIIARTYSSGNMWLIIGIMYIILITILTKLSNVLERKMSND